MQKIKTKGQVLLKRASAFVMAAAMLSCINGGFAKTDVNAAEVKENTVMYYETFDNGAEGIKDTYTQNGNNYTYSDDYGKMVYNFRYTENLGGLGTAEYMGNKGIGIELSPQGTANADQRMEYTLNEPINSGMFAYSFDVSRLDRGSFGQSYLGINYADTSKRKYMLYIEGAYIYGPANNLSNWGNSSANNGEYKANTVYHVSQVFDMNNRKSYTYVDGKLITETTIPSTTAIESFRFLWSGLIGYIDNFKIEKADALYMTVSGVTADLKENTATVMFGDGIDSSKLPKDGYAITDMETGTEYTATATLGADTKLVVSAEDLTMTNGGVYLLSLPEIYGNGGDKAEAQKIVVSAGTGDKLNDFTLTDSRGEKHKNSGKIPADVKNISLEFSTADAASGAQISVKDKNGADLTCTKDIDGKKVEVTLDKYLIGDSAYKLLVSTTVKDYEISLNTDKGGIKTADCSFYINGTKAETLDGIQSGDTVKVVLTAVKTVAEEKKILSAYSMFSGNSLSGFDYAEKTMTADDDTATFTFEKQITNPVDLSVKAFLKNELGTVNPIGEIFGIK